jgi:hypothetical protein
MRTHRIAVPLDEMDSSTWSAMRAFQAIEFDLFKVETGSFHRNPALVYADPIAGFAA